MEVKVKKGAETTASWWIESIFSVPANRPHCVDMDCRSSRLGMRYVGSLLVGGFYYI